MEFSTVYFCSSWLCLFCLTHAEVELYAEIWETGYANGAIGPALFKCSRSSKGAVKNQDEYLTVTDCRSILSKSEVAKVHAAVNFYRTTAASFLDKHMVLFDGTPILDDRLSDIDLGFDPTTIKQQPEQIFKPHCLSQSSLKELMQEVFNLMKDCSYPQAADKSQYSLMANFFGINDVSAFSCDPAAKKQLQINFNNYVTVLERVVQGARKPGASQKFKRFMKGKWRTPVETEATIAARQKAVRELNVLFLHKMIDPCTVLRYDTLKGNKKAQQEIQYFCNTYCKFLGVAAVTFALEEPECHGFAAGMCADGLCKCFQLRSWGSRMIGRSYRAGQKMLLCNNKLRHKAILTVWEDRKRKGQIP